MNFLYVKCGQVKKQVGLGISDFFFLKCRGEFGDVENNFQSKKMFCFYENFSILVSEVNFNDFGKRLIFSNFFPFFHAFFEFSIKNCIRKK